MAERPALRGTVYIVDDDPAMRDALSFTLEAAGLRACAFGTPEGMLRSGAIGARVGSGALDGGFALCTPRTLFTAARICVISSSTFFCLVKRWPFSVREQRCAAARGSAGR